MSGTRFQKRSRRTIASDCRHGSARTRFRDPCPATPPVLATPRGAGFRPGTEKVAYHDHDQWRPDAATTAAGAIAQRAWAIHQGFLVRESECAALPGASREPAG